MHVLDGADAEHVWPVGFGVSETSCREDGCLTVILPMAFADWPFTVYVSVIGTSPDAVLAAADVTVTFAEEVLESETLLLEVVQL